MLRAVHQTLKLDRNSTGLESKFNLPPPTVLSLVESKLNKENDYCFGVGLPGCAQLLVDPIPLLLSVRASFLGASGVGNFKSSPKAAGTQYREDHVDF